ncbi:MAG: peptidylprolyl isomerase, partial [bacterium]|nr:peptidylprolyl isomerase [bacterium]
IGGMNYVDTIAQGEPPANPTVILQASIESDGKPPVVAPPPPPAPEPSIIAPKPVKPPVAKKPTPKKK